MKIEEKLFKQNFWINSKMTDESVNENSQKDLSNIFGHKSSLLIDKFIDHYDKRNKHNRGLRISFFVLSFIALFIVIGALAAFAVLIAVSGTINVEAVISLVGACGTIIASIIFLPKLVGHNLFPEKEDNEILTFVQEMNKTELHFEELFYGKGKEFDNYYDDDEDRQDDLNEDDTRTDKIEQCDSNAQKALNSLAKKVIEEKFLNNNKKKNE